MYNLHSIHSSRGSALVMSMIFLLVLTIAGITAMRFASLEESMAANSQTSAYVFQQAQSEINTHLKYFATAGGRNRLNGLDYQSLAKETDARVLKYLPATASQEKDLKTVPGSTLAAIKNVRSNGEQDRKIRFLRDGNCMDGSSIGQFICIDFEFEVEAAVGNGAHSRQTQGFTFKNNVADGN